MIVPEMSSKDYHAHKAIGSTTFSEFVRFPAAAEAVLRYGIEETDSMTLGTWSHCALLEPERFKREHVWIKGPMNRNPFKKEADDAKAAGLTPIGDTDWGRIQGMLESIDKHPEAKILTTTGQNEVSCFATDPNTGVEMKCRGDSVLWKKQKVADFKTIRSIDPKDVRNSIISLKYDIKTAWYLRVISIITGQSWSDFVHIFVETKRPHGVRCVALGDQTIRRAEILIEAQLPRLKECLTSGVWPPASQGIETVEVQFFDREEYL